MKRIDLVVTRHPGLVDYLRELGMTDDGVEVISHATPEVVTGKHVCGVLPHSLSCLTASFTEVPLKLTPELRGVELDLETLREIAGKPVTYIIIRKEEGKHGKSC
jgi:putative CRISPR-associated protein (TIGR02620 family)